MTSQFKYFWLKWRRVFRLNNEFRKQLRTFINVALAFSVAFTWRQTMFDLSFNLVKVFTNIQDNSALSILASTLITIVALIIIYLISFFLKDRPNHYY